MDGFIYDMWMLLVWIISTICYVPLFISHQGMAVPSMIINLRYAFVFVPLFLTLVFLLRNKGIKKWLIEMFELRVQVGALVCCLIIGVTGILFTNMLTMQEWKLQTLLVGMAYLFLMALIEEVAWRGYRLRIVAKKTKTEMVAILFVSLEWAVWHIPMWMIRNFIGIGEIIYWIIYTVIVGGILGKAFMRYRNILVPILLHTIFNVFFLMPIHINVFVVLGILVANILFEKIERLLKN